MSAELNNTVPERLWCRLLLPPSRGPAGPRAGVPSSLPRRSRLEGVFEVEMEALHQTVGLAGGNLLSGRAGC
jgi:hypothetical protein